MPPSTLTFIHQLTLDIGAMPIVVRTGDARFVRMIEERYGEFVNAHRADAVAKLDVEVVESARLVADDSESWVDADSDARVHVQDGFWIMERADFRAEWNPQSCHGCVRLAAHPYALDGVLRILHSLILARAGGFLVHAASAVRNGRAFIFAGVSGAGKSTLARLAPPDVTLLTDEISYVRQVRGGSCQGPGASPRAQILVESDGWRLAPTIDALTPDTWNLASAFQAFGTPFAGELARLGQKMEAPVAALLLLAQGAENRIESLSAAEAARQLLRHVLFFSHDDELVAMVFATVCEFVKCVPVGRLTFAPDTRVWELMQ